MNIFEEEQVAQEYDAYYTSDQGRVIDALEKEAISKLMKSIPRLPMLEIGCGTGHWTTFFEANGFTITATDISEAMMAQAKLKEFQNVSFQVADVTNLPFGNEEFDCVSVITALEFCGNLELAFSEMYRVLKPGGWLITGCLNAESTLGKMKKYDPVFSHGNFMSKTELEQQLAKFGEPEIQECVHLSGDFTILDQTNEQSTVAGAFMAAAVQKTK